MGDLWGYITLLCCAPDDGGDGDATLSFAYDNAFFDLEELKDAGTQGRLPHLLEHGKIAARFIEAFKAGAADAGKSVDEGKRKEAKHKLLALHDKLSKILDPKESKDPKEPGDKE